jgi:hypothetical protein
MSDATLVKSCVLGWFSLALVACDPGYTLAPTPCDDYCHATQRGGCKDDDPAECVRDCESQGSAPRDACVASRRDLDDCWLRLDVSVFACVDHHTRLPDDQCLDERRALSECLEPGSAPCFDECLRQVKACGAVLSDCESACQHQDPACASTNFAYQACLQDFPVECHTWGEPETRQPEDIPCFDLALEVLACAKL